MSGIDWRGIAEALGTITWTDSGRSEQGGTRLACEALVKIIGDEALRDAVDFYVSGQPGNELARSILWLLSPPAAMERCREIFRTSDDAQEQSDAIGLLQVVADRRVLDWIPEFQASENPGVRTWAVGILDQLLIMKDAITQDETRPLLECALADPHEAVRARAQQVLDAAADKARYDISGGAGSRRRVSRRRLSQPAPALASHQMCTRSLGARYSFSPGWTLNAGYQASRLRTVIARHRAGAWPSVATRARSD
jgi:hypothetical protein